MIQFELKSKVLKAMNLLASTDETRYALNGVLLDCAKARDLLVATDGKRIGVLQLGKITPEETVGEFIIPSPFIEALTEDSGLFSIDKETTETALITALPVRGSVTIQSALIPAHYPKWRPVIPKEKVDSVSRVPINATFMGDFLRIAEQLGSDPHNGIIVFAHGRGTEEGRLPISIRLEHNDDFYGALMCLRAIGKTEAIPDFVL